MGNYSNLEGKPVVLVRMLTSWKVNLAWTLVIMIVSVYYATKSGEASWVSRAGAMVTLAGLLLTTRSLLRHRVDEALRSRTVTDGGTFSDSEEERRQELAHINEIRKDVVAEKTGLWFMILGTICWAYGDLVFDLFRAQFR